VYSHDNDQKPRYKRADKKAVGWMAKLGGEREIYRKYRGGGLWQQARGHRAGNTDRSQWILIPSFLQATAAVSAS
jgi:hypothetical protein